MKQLIKPLALGLFATLLCLNSPWRRFAAAMTRVLGAAWALYSAAAGKGSRPTTTVTVNPSCLAAGGPTHTTTVGRGDREAARDRDRA